MKTSEALVVAERIWNYNISDHSPFETLLRAAPSLQAMKNEGLTTSKKADQELSSLKNEIIASWANIIIESSDGKEKTI